MCADYAVTKFKGDVQAYKVCTISCWSRSCIDISVTEHYREQHQSTAMMVVCVLCSMAICRHVAQLNLFQMPKNKMNRSQYLPRVVTISLVQIRHAVPQSHQICRLFYLQVNLLRLCLLHKMSLRCGHVLMRTVTRPRFVPTNIVSFIQHQRLRPADSFSTMSSSEGESFDLENVSGTESEDYAPPIKKTVSRT